ncbi:MAG: ATP-binding cassette domain-containing protein [Rubrobacter sp.]|nr:ATP-binding cassette domain-containing protein [Rubrobacter sp.]
MIVVEDLSKSFGSRTLWSGVSFTVDRGEMLALVGPSGAGKSTLLNCIGLLETADGGEIRVDGSDITRFGRGARRRFRRDTLGYLFQNYALIDNATVSANLDVAVAASGVALRRRRREYGAALARVGLAGRAKEKIYRLSGGEQQRVALARLLVKKPALILADEPTGALDKANEAMVMEVLREMSRQGATVIVATHQDRVQAGCDSLFEVGSR